MRPTAAGEFGVWEMWSQASGFAPSVGVALAIACAIGLAVHLAGETGVFSERVRAGGKLGASAAFVALGALAGGGSAPAFTLVIGLGLCAVGDALLLSRARSRFLAGMAVFAIGHGAYIAAFVLAGMAVTHDVFVGTVVLVIAGAAIFRKLSPHLGRDRPAVGAYVAVIVVMVAASFGHVAAGGWGVFALAAAMFAVSDVFVARDQFIRSALVNKAAGLPLYFGAQTLLALGAAYLR